MQQYRKNLGKVSLTAEGVWNIKSKYDVLSIVYDENTQHGFISKQPVPIGVDLYNSEYWMPLNVSGYVDSNIIILNKKSSDASIETYTLEEAVKSIASVGRKPGCILGFYNSNANRLDISGRWEIWQFNSTTISEWEDLNNWQNIYYNYNQFVGWYRNEEQLKVNNPYPEIGCYAYVGNVLNEAVVYRCEIKHKWTETTQHAWDYVKVIVNGNVTVGENGNWFNNGEDTGIPASLKGENGKTPVFREKDNTIQYSFDNVNWITISDKVAAWFRWNATTGDTQANNVGRIQISRDNVTWTNLSGDIINNLHISRYIGADETLPTSGIAEGTIYAKGPTYADGDTSNANPIYRLWVYAWKGNTLTWQDNGEFTSIAAGVVQETGNSETEVMSQKAVTEELSELGLKTAISSSTYNDFAQAKNLCGAECMDISEYKYILWTDGSIAVDNVSRNYKTRVSFPFAVDWRKGKVCVSGHTFDKTMGYRFIDAFGEIIGFGRMAEESTNSTTIVIPEGASYMQISLINTGIDYSMLQVEYGEVVTEFERYSGFVGQNIQNSIFLKSKSFVEIGKNLYSRTFIDTSAFQYIDRVTGNIESIGHTLRTTYPIPISADRKNITLSIIAPDTLAGTNGYRILDADLNPISWGAMSGIGGTDTNNNVISLPFNASFIQLTVYDNWSANTLQMEYGTEATTYERYKGNSALNNINIQTLSIANIASNTKNICGLDCFDKNKYQYIYPGDGHLETANAEANGLVTTYPIAVDSNNLKLTISGINMGNLALYRFLDKNGNIIIADRLGSADNVVTIKTVTIPSGSVFFQMSNLLSNLSDKLQVEYGNNATSFEKYSGIYSKTTNEEKIELNLKEITIAKGSEKAYYFNGISSLPLESKQIFRHDYAKNYDRFFVFNENSSSSQLSEKQYKLDVATNKLNVNEREIYNIPMNVFDASMRSGKSVNILCVGDSFTNMGIWNTGLQVLAKKDGITINSIGLMQGDYTDSDYPTIKCNSENQAGGTLFNSFMQDRFANNFGGRSYKVSVNGIASKLNTTFNNNTLYQDSNGVVWAVTGTKLVNGNGYIRLTAAYSNQRDKVLDDSGILTKISGVGDSSMAYTLIEEVNRNPFWNPSANKIDFKYYINTWGFEEPNILIFMFGWNDVYAWGTVPSSQYITLEQEVEYIKAFISQFRTDYPNAKAIFSVPTYGKSDIGIRYFTNGIKYARQVVYEMLYNYYKNDSNVSIVPSYMSVDDVLAFNMEETTPINRYPNKTITVATDEVHNNTEGMLQISDAIYPYILKYI